MLVMRRQRGVERLLFFSLISDQLLNKKPSWIISHNYRLHKLRTYGLQQLHLVDICWKYSSVFAFQHWGLRTLNTKHIICFGFFWVFFQKNVVSVISMCAGLSLVVGLVLYISSINDEVMNRPREPEQFFHYRYGWSFAFAASSFLLKEVFARRHTHTCMQI